MNMRDYCPVRIEFFQGREYTRNGLEYPPSEYENNFVYSDAEYETIFHQLFNKPDNPEDIIQGINKLRCLCVYLLMHNRIKDFERVFEHSPVECITDIGIEAYDACSYAIIYGDYALFKYILSIAFISSHGHLELIIKYKRMDMLRLIVNEYLHDGSDGYYLGFLHECFLDVYPKDWHEGELYVYQFNRDEEIHNKFIGTE